MGPAKVTCVICCTSRKADFHPADKSASTSTPRGRKRGGGGRDGGEDDQHQPEDVFRTFAEELLSLGGGLELDLTGRNLSVCSDCLSNMSVVMETNGRMKMLEEGVRKLQLRLVQDLKELKVYMDLLRLQLGKIEKSVKESSSDELEDSLKNVGRPGRGGGVGGKRGRNAREPRGDKDDDVLLVRAQIANVTEDLRLFRDGLSQKIDCGNFVQTSGSVSGPTQVRSNVTGRGDPKPGGGGGRGRHIEETLGSTSTWDDLEDDPEGGADFDDNHAEAEVVGAGSDHSGNEDEAPNRSGPHEGGSMGAQDEMDVDVKPSISDANDGNHMLDLDGEYLLPPSTSSPTTPLSTGPGDSRSGSGTISNQEDPPPHSAAKRPRRASTKNTKSKPVAAMSASDNKDSGGDGQVEDDDDDDFSCSDNDDEDDDDYASDDGPSSKSRKTSKSSSFLIWQALNTVNVVVDTTGMSDFKKFLIRRSPVVEEPSREDFTGADNVTSDPNPSSIEAHMSRVESYFLSAPIVYSTSTKTLHLNGIEIRINDEDKTLECSQCSHSAKVMLPSRSRSRGKKVAKLSIRKHILFHHMHLLKCPLCQVEHKSLRSYKAHLETHKEGASPPKSGKFPCPICNKSLPTKGHLERHIWGHKSQEEREAAFYVDDLRVTCVDCGKLVVRRHLKAHKELICLPEGAPRIQCPHCDMTFKNKSTLGMHVQRFHTNRGVGVEERPFKCKICDKGFRAKKDVTRHEWIHRKEKDFVCGKGCGKGFNYRRKRTMHEAVCKGQKKSK